jgi:xeroderma pigmentosum group C-complementing protein
MFMTDPDAARAARLLRVDYADAVIGFEFKGRRGTAIVCGIVAAAEYREALEAVVQGFADEREEEMIAKRSMRVLAFWKRFLVGLRIRERIAGYEIPGEAEQVEREVLMGQEADEEADEEYEGGGGLFPERGEESAAEPTAGKLLHQERRRRKAYGDAHQSEEEDDKEPQDSPDAALYGGGFIPDEISTDKPKDWKWGDGGGFVTQEGSTYTATGGGFLFDDGGFIPEDNTPTSGGGGFLPIDDSDREVVEDVTQHFHSDDGLATTAGEPSLLVEKPLLTPSDEETAAVIPNQDTRLSHSPPSAELSHGTSVDIDNTSLLSHDPEDDDAEPDWLLSD